MDKVFSLKSYNRKLRKSGKIFNQIILVVKVDILSSHIKIKMEGKYKGVIINKPKAIDL